jgi:hypothetical protein
MKRNMKKVINKPIFIVGCGRSGTTLLYNLLCGHKNLAWFSNFTDRFPKFPQLSKFHFLYKNPMVPMRFHKPYLPSCNLGFAPYFSPIPIPSEAYRLFNLFHSADVHLPSRRLTEEDVINAKVNLMKKSIQQHLYYSKADRFVSKNIRNSLRIPYLNKIFPDALYIQVIRDGHAVVNSLLNIDWWPNLHLWYIKERKTPAELICEGKDEILLATKLWKENVKCILSDSANLPKNQYMELRYETLVKKPKAVLPEVLKFCELEWSEKFERFINSFSIKNRNYKWKQNFSKENVLKIEKEIGPLLEKLGY